MRLAADAIKHNRKGKAEGHTFWLSADERELHGREENTANAVYLAACCAGVNSESAALVWGESQRALGSYAG